MGQNVSLLTSVTCPTVTVGPVVSKLDLTLKLPLFLKLKLLRPTLLEFKMEVVEEEEEPSDSFDEQVLSKTVVPIHLGEVQRLRAIGVGMWTLRYARVVVDAKGKKNGSDE